MESNALAAELTKLNSTDSDLRLMALSDIGKQLRNVPGTSKTLSSRDHFLADQSSESRLVNKVTEILQTDPNSEVKNMAVSVIAVLSKRCRRALLHPMIQSLTDGINSKSEEEREIACLALKAVVSEITITDQKQIIEPEVETQTAAQLCQILSDLYTRTADFIVISDKIQSSAQKSLIPLFFSATPAIRKRVISTFAVLVSVIPNLFDDHLKGIILQGLQGDNDGPRTSVFIINVLAKTSLSSKIGVFVQENDSAVIRAIIDLAELAPDVDSMETIEAALGTLETLLLRCPTEMSGFIMPVTQLALDLIKYDPNYVTNDEEDEDMEDEQEEDDEYDEDPYSDDEDDSWKLRRAAAKILYALIGTRNEYLTEFFNSAALPLIARFSEREESVRLEVLSAFENFLKQTAIAKSAEVASGGRNKRKRSQEMDEDSVTEDSIITSVRTCVPSLLKSLLKQLSSKSILTREKSFNLLRLVTEILEGDLDTSSDSICDASVQALRYTEGASSSLTIAALSFFTVFFKYQISRVYAKHLPALVPSIVRCMKSKLQRVSFEAFTTASALAQSARPRGSSSPLPNPLAQPIEQLLAATTDVLGDATVDGEVREQALETLGTLLVHEGDVLSFRVSTCLPLIGARLGSEATATAAIVVIGKIADSTTCEAPEFDSWFLETLPHVVSALRRSRKTSSRAPELICLQNILLRLGDTLPPAKAIEIVSELRSTIDTAPSIQVIATLLEQQPACRPPVVELVPSVLQVVKSSNINSALIDALLRFFGAYVDGDVDCATRLVPALVDNLGTEASLPNGTIGGASAQLTTAKCIGMVVKHSQRNAAGVVTMFHRMIKSAKATEASVYLALLCVGEIGRTTDLSANTDLFELTLTLFQNLSEVVQSAAAFAVGNMAVGSPRVLLPMLVRHIESGTTENVRILLLHALKEVVLHSPTAQLEVIVDSLWRPLFESPKSAKKAGEKEELGDDGIRNVKAACIGKLTTAAPARFLPQLQELLRSSPENRALVAAAVRYTFTDTSSSYDELIAPIIVDFLSLMHDENLVVRRLSLASLNAAMQNKPHLIFDKLGVLQPLLYQETEIKPELQRTIMMGPFKVTQDDGLENRKTAYETMYTLLGASFYKVDLGTFTDRVLAALKDVNEIKVLGLMLLLRLGECAPTTILPRLDDTVESLKGVMKDVEVKDDTVKQDLERKGKAFSHLVDQLSHPSFHFLIFLPFSSVHVHTSFLLSHRVYFIRNSSRQ
ncbi:hypothetical protein M231_05984 [Tremella mesenterica]|uniref:TATA-binding protein interacting (TIP20) domain-containing protein n=1 Tax=Tremella mesenterica TaxID=5217 RepID=A0A4Q1BGP9_TREME|nr:hypothetical protein M231_05984 [Tremella mesenterica]